MKFLLARGKDHAGMRTLAHFGVLRQGQQSVVFMLGSDGLVHHQGQNVFVKNIALAVGQVFEAVPCRESAGGGAAPVRRQDRRALVALDGLRRRGSGVAPDRGLAAREAGLVPGRHLATRLDRRLVQIKDDLFDYGNENVGKPTGNDIKEKKLTLPLIYTLNNCDVDLKKKIISIIKNDSTNKKKVSFVIEAVHRSGGIKYAYDKMFAFRDEALSILYEFPESEVRDALEQLVRYTTDRKY